MIRLIGDRPWNKCEHKHYAEDEQKNSEQRLVNMLSLFREKHAANAVSENKKNDGEAV